MAVAGPRDIALDKEAPQTVRSDRHKASWAVLFLCWMAAAAALYVARDIAVPVLLSILLALLLRPLLRRLQHLRIPTVAASILIVFVVAAILLGVMVTVAQQGQVWLAKAPDTLRRVGAMIPQQHGPLGNLFRTTEAVREMAQPEPAQPAVPVVMQSSDTTFTVLGASGHLVGATLVVLVLTYFLLSFSDTLLRQAIESRSTFGEKKTVVSLLHNIENGISRYLATVTIINMGLGLVTALALWLLDIPNPLLWGVLATVLNFVPHLGALACEIVLFFVGAVAHESLWYGAGAAAVFAVITTVESYFITPLVLSKSLQLSPLAVIMSVLFWGWLWGIAGGIMAAPLLTIVKIVSDQFESLRPISILLSGESKPAGDSVNASVPGATSIVVSTQPARPAA